MLIVALENPVQQLHWLEPCWHGCSLISFPLKPPQDTAVGIQMQVDYLQRQFWAAMKQDLDCFLIDNNGFILISQRPQEMGRFLGEVDGALMAQLLSMGVFSRVTMYDYQAMCEPPDHRHSAAQALISSFTCQSPRLCSASCRFLLQWSTWGSWQDKGSEAHKHKKQDLLHPCDTEYPVFVHQTSIQEANGIIECEACQKTFVMQQIPSSNLLLLVTDLTCDCSAYSPILQEATEVKYILHIPQGRGGG
ncbi:Voltage-dependent calcium channel subunit alpha-2/delta-4 [Microtus ochrogaster]|uniref:Voltage-dependent calcium channel subunit alpha-2/delta-4 n=1 Tax=Microtus ochrogaster TaxID=79684 RepID=A0A8J6KWS6_MICOH|nr:Voltage-dependent calcium channel subunit alpha-2/delta-4 [Microtus ochrogaster]